MKKNLMFGSIITAMVLLGTGCGGGSSDDDTTTSASASTTASTSDTEKTAYYWDSAVSGVAYTCSTPDETTQGDLNSTELEAETTTESTLPTMEEANVSSDLEENLTSAIEDANATLMEKSSTTVQKTTTGITDEYGAFSYEEGAICTFSVGDIVLRTVDTSTLEENILLEDNLPTAQFLQTLDLDGNPTNGIQIVQAIVDALSSSDIDLKSVPQDETELTTLVSTLQEKVEDYNGSIVTPEEAEAHLSDTKATIEAMGGHFSLVADEDQAEITTDDASGSASDEGVSASVENLVPVETEETPMETTEELTDEVVLPTDTEVTPQEVTEEISDNTITTPETITPEETTETLPESTIEETPDVVETPVTEEPAETITDEAVVTSPVTVSSPV